MIRHVRKRNGSIVAFDRSRIDRAIACACEAVHADIGQAGVLEITDRVLLDIETVFQEKIPSVEAIQDIVERVLAASGLFDVAKAYILYRKEHENLREERRAETLHKLETREVNVRRRDGSLVPFDVNQILSAVLGAFAEYRMTDEDKQAISEIVEECKRSIYEGISTQEINRAVVLIMRSRIERDPRYSEVTARFMLNDLYKQMLGVDEFDGSFVDIYRSMFVQQIGWAVRLHVLDERMLSFDLQVLSDFMRPERDKLLKYMGLETLHDRYLLRDHDRILLELPQYFWMRVAMGLALNEERKEDRAIEFYDAMSQLLYIPSTPTLFHAGTCSPQLSSCYLTTVDDNLAHIYKCIGDNAQLSKWSGGLGNDWTNIRGTGAQVRSIKASSQGLIPFLKVVDATTGAINRSGNRRGALCAYIEPWHYDVLDFIELRKNTGDERRRTHEINTALWIPDLFMKRVMADSHWTLISPDEVHDLHDLYGRAFNERYEEYEWQAEQGYLKLYKRMQAVDLWRKMLTMLYETGHPWITFKDPCNIRSPQDHVGVVHSSNLCTEITLNTSAEETAVCNLGSINLSAHIDDRSLFDWGWLRQTIEVAIRMLDNVIDLNFYPTPEGRTSNLRHRPIGLGIMGLQDLLYKSDVHFDSDEAVALSDKVMEYISCHAILASSSLAKEKGAYKSYEGSKWHRGIFPQDTIALLEKERGQSILVDRSSLVDWEPVRAHVKAHGMRNSNVLAIAPTATISNIAGCTPSIEPIYKNLYVKSNQSGDFTIINEYLVNDLKKHGLWTQEMMESIKRSDGDIHDITAIPPEIREKYEEAFAISPEWVLCHAAVRSKWIDQSQSLNIFLDTASGRVLSEVYMTAWRMGLKTTYYLRTLGASSVEKSTLSMQRQACKIDDSTCESCQ